MTKFFVYLGAAFSVSLTLAACSHKQTRVEQTTSVHAEGEKHIAASLNWVKNKKDSVDLEVRIVNNTDAPVRVYGSEAVLSFGGMKITPRQAGDMRIPPGVTSQVVMVFNFGKGKPIDGPAELTITPYAEEKALAPVKITFSVVKM